MQKALSKNKVYFFLNAKYGGVYSVVKNIITYSQFQFDYHIIILVNKSITPDFIALDYLDKEKQHVFKYNPSDNFYTTCKRLARIIPDQKAVLVANDWLELGMVSLLGMNNPVVQIVHGNYDYYFELAQKHSDSVNYFVAVSESIAERVKIGLGKKCSKVAHVPFPVNMGVIHQHAYKELRILFIAADLKCPNKNFQCIKDINAKLEENGIKAKWNVVGGGYAIEEMKEWWGNSNNELIYHGFLQANELTSVFNTSNVYLLPSAKEGLPVSLVEAMSNGLVPIINLWDDGILSLVKSGVNGYVVEKNDVNLYFKYLVYLNSQIQDIGDMGKKAFEAVVDKFNPNVQVHQYEKIFSEVYGSFTSRKPQKVYGSRLDHPLIPNFITRNYRELTNRFHG